MNAWWAELIVFQRVLFVIGCATTLFLIAQIIMMLIGMGNDDSFDADTSTDADSGDLINDTSLNSAAALRLLSMRSVLAFFSIGSWVIFTLCYALPIWAAVLIGIACGTAAGVGVAFFLYGLNKMQSSGNIDVRNSVGKSGEIYLTVPSNRAGVGKINVFMQERLVELEAVTDGEAIKTGSQARILSFVNEGLVVVEPFSTNPSEIQQVSPPDTTDKTADITL